MSIELQKVTVRFRHFEALSEVSLSIPAGTRLAVVGESGAGKSTFLNLAAELVSPSTGKATVLGFSPGSAAVLPKVGFVFQTDALFPHLSIRQNVELPLKARKWPKEDSQKRVDELLDLAGIAEQAEKRPGELSGGQRQRASIARALASSPDVLLLDEPFASLDGPLRRRLRELVIGERRTQKRTTILVTHDPEEAMAFGKRLVVLKDGRIVADGQPRDLYWRPADAYVAGLLGECNVLDGTLSEHSLSLCGIGEFSHAAFRRYGATKPVKVKVFIRPAALTALPCRPMDSAGVSVMEARVTWVRDTGRFLSLAVRPRGSSVDLRVDLLGGSAFEAGETVFVSATWDQVHIQLIGAT